MNETITTNVKQAIPFLGMSNIDESLRFYVDGVGFVMTKQWVTSLSDPDGYRIDFVSYTDVPEETEYAVPAG